MLEYAVDISCRFVMARGRRYEIGDSAAADPLLRRVERRSRRAAVSPSGFSFREYALYLVLARDYGTPLTIAALIGLLGGTFLFAALALAVWDMLGEALDAAKAGR